MTAPHAAAADSTEIESLGPCRMKLLIKIKIEIIYQLRFALRCFTATVVKYFTSFAIRS